MRLTGILISAALIASCGAKKDDKAKAPAVSEQDALAKGKTLPAVTLIRVPVGSDGVEDKGKAEVRLTDTTSIAADSVGSVFDSANVPDKTIDELDNTSSTESFCGYFFGGLGGYGYYNWMSFMPAYYYGGYNFMWNYANAYPAMGGYNYYQYNQGFNGGYSGYNNSPGYGQQGGYGQPGGNQQPATYPPQGGYQKPATYPTPGTTPTYPTQPTQPATGQTSNMTSPY